MCYVSELYMRVRSKAFGGGGRQEMGVSSRNGLTRRRGLDCNKVQYQNK